MLMGFTLKHLLVLSLALNVGLISRVVYVGEKSVSGLCLENQDKKEAHDSKKSRLVTSNVKKELQNGGDGVIDLDQGYRLVLTIYADEGGGFTKFPKSQGYK
ncbi:unnamed protein product [Ilex paraguariensis]